MNLSSASNPTAQAVDNVLIYIFGFSAILLLGITVVTIWFVIKYRRSKYPEPTSQVEGSWFLETLWTLLPTLIVMSMFWYGWINYVGLRNVPEGALEVKGTARMWSWQFEYPNGRKDSKLYVPINTPIKVELHSVDVLHNFFVPAFRIKRDTVPGMDNYIWFTATEPGSYDVFCAEYCGVGHADMITSVEALSPEDYELWLNPPAEEVAAAAAEPRGLTVINELGCIGCHSLDGSDGIGPSLFELAGKTRTLEKDGNSFEAAIDEVYLKRALREPNAEIVAGYNPIMPSYDEETLSEEDLQATVDYLLGKVEVTEPPLETGLDVNQLLEDNGCLGCHSSDGSDSIGPTFQGISSRKFIIERDGEELEISADEDYLRRALLEPEADMVKGYMPIMPASDYLSEEELDAIIVHLLKQ